MNAFHVMPLRSVIRTYTGRLVDVGNFDPSQFRVEDVAHALSLLNPLGGHTRAFYCYAQHCVYAARLCDPLDALWAILAYAPLAYIGHRVPISDGYSGTFSTIMGQIARGQRLTKVMPRGVLVIYRALYATMLRDLTPNMDLLPRDFPRPYPFTIHPDTSEKAEELFIQTYETALSTALRV